MTKCVRSTLVDYYRDYEIYREVDKRVDPSTLETYGHERVFYVVYEIPENMIEGMQGSYVREVKIKRSVVHLIGCANWSDLIGKEIEYSQGFTHHHGCTWRR